jgi:hypothetical protein
MDCDLRRFDLPTRLLDPADNQFGPRCYLCNRYITFSNPGLRAGPVISLVEPMGFEPTTSSMPSRRAPNCATAPPGRLSDVSIRAQASSMRVPQSVVVSPSNISGESQEFSKSNKCVN